MVSGVVLEYDADVSLSLSSYQMAHVEAHRLFKMPRPLP
jgi:hypothetical protein